MKHLLARKSAVYVMTITETVNVSNSMLRENKTMGRQIIDKKLLEKNRHTFNLVSPVLIDMIKTECRCRRIDFSNYIRLGGYGSHEAHQK